MPLPLASIVFLLAFMANLAAAPALFSNPDLPWHIAAGDLFRAKGIVTTDSWSFTAADTFWYNLSWLWDIALSWIVEHTGMTGLYLLSATLGAAILATLAFTLKSRGNISDFFNALTLLIVWYALLASQYPQPWMATLLFSIIFHHILHQSRTHTGIKTLLPLPLLMALWANLHGGFIIGLSIIVFFIIEAQQTRQTAWMKRLVLCATACVLASFINPYHVFIIHGVMQSMGSVIAPYLADWQPVTIGQPTSFTLLLLLFVCCSNLRDPRAPLADRMLALAWLIYALHTRRNFMIFAVLSAPYLAYSLQEFARHAQGAKFKIMPDLSDSPSHRKKFLGVAVAFFLVVLFTPLKSTLIAAEKLNDDPYEIRPLLAFLKKEEPQLRFINNYNLGGHLIYTSHGTLPVFVDGRADTSYPKSLLKDYIAFAMATADAEKIPSRYNIDGIIVLNNDPLEQQLMAANKIKSKIFSGPHISAYILIN